MATIQQRFEVERPLAAVYETLAQPQLILESLPGVTTVRRLSDDAYNVTVGYGGSAVQLELQLTSKVPPRHIEWRTSDRTWSGVIDLELLGAERTAVAISAESAAGAESEGISPPASAVHEAIQAFKRALQPPQVRVSTGGSAYSGWEGAGSARRYASEWRDTAQSALTRPTEFPFRLMRTLSRQMDRIWSDVLRGTPIPRLPQILPGGPWNPDVEVCEQDDMVRVCIDVPGVDESHLQVEIEDGALTVRGERQDERGSDPGRRRTELHYGAFTRRIPLPDAVDPDGARAFLRNGVLEIRIPIHRREPRRVPVQHAG